MNRAVAQSELAPGAAGEAVAGSVPAAAAPSPRALTGIGRTMTRIDIAIKHATEFVAAFIVAVETIVLLIGVTARYIFQNPTVWTDELASGLFLWLCMFGAVVALQRSEHMRLTTVAKWMPPVWQKRMVAFSAVMVTSFVALTLLPAVTYAVEEWDILTPALQVHDTFRVMAMPIGLGLMLIVALIQISRHVAIKDLVPSVAVVVGVGLLLWWLKPVWQEIGTYNLIVFFVVLVTICVVASVPIAIAFGSATLAYLAVMTHMPLSIVVSRMDEGMSTLILLAVPLFVFLGLLIEMTGLAKAIIDFLAALLGHVRGGLSYVLLGAMFLVSGISGAKVADMAAVAPALFPEMERRGSNRGELIALLSASGAMTDTIPPSLFLITLGSVCGVSIAGLFTGGLLPAALLALCLCVVVGYESRHDNVAGIERHSTKAIVRLGIISAPALAMPFLIRWAVVDGVATATEVSTLGIAYSLLAGLLIYRRFDWKRIYPMLIETASLSGAILLILGCATAMAWALTQSGMSHKLVEAMRGLPGGQAIFLAASVVAFAVLGSVLEGIPSIVLFGPLLFPVARALGVNDIHYSMVIVVAMGLGLFAPPFGVGFYGACAVGRGSPDSAMKRIWVYLAALLVGLIIIAAVPEISTCLL
jgi:tripartite ATP-independent transporter DctM subunit